MDVNPTEYAEQLHRLDEMLSGIERVLDLGTMRATRAELEAEAASPGLWDDQEKAQQVTAQLAQLNSEIARLEGLRRQLDDAKVLHELAEAEQDQASLAEVGAEIDTLTQAIRRLETRTLLSGEYDQREAVVAIRAGAGGVDAADFAEMLLRMYLRWADRHNYPYEVYDTSYAEEAGIKSATFVVKAPYAYGTLSVEAGTHRLVRISPFDNQGRRQTSFAGVEVLPVVEQTDKIDIPEHEIRVDVFRSSGPGGQSVNTTDSAVRITHLPTGIVVSCQNEKSQLQNREQAMRILRARLLAVAREQADAEAADARRAQVRTVDRSERIRTYNFPQNRITDHRIGYTAYNLDLVLDGELDPVLDALAEADRRARLAGEPALARP